MIDGIRARFRVSVAEVDHQDLHQRAALGIALVSAEAAICAEVADDIERFVWSIPDLEVIEVVRTWTEFD